VVLVIIGCIGSVLPVVQDVIITTSPPLFQDLDQYFVQANPKSGILQAAIVGAYTSYVIASAISSEPTAGGCVPDSSSVFSQVCASPQSCALTEFLTKFNLSTQILFYTGFSATFAALCVNAYTTTSSDHSMS